MLEWRAAQLTLDSGYQKFVVVDRAVTSERRSNYVPGPSDASGSPPARSPSRMETSTIAKGRMTIRMVNAADSSAKAVDASAIRARLHHPMLIGVAGG